MSIIILSERREDTVPPEHCSGEKTLLHWPRCSVAPHQPIREFHLKRRGMALKVPKPFARHPLSAEWKRIPLLLEAA